MWEKLTGARIVDVRQVKQSFQTYTYLVKYLSKLHNLEWTERHVSYSRGFFPPPLPDTFPKRNLVGLTLLPLHPYTYLANNYAGRPVCHTTPGTFVVDLELSASDEISTPETSPLDAFFGAHSLRDPSFQDANVPLCPLTKSDEPANEATTENTQPPAR
jgi:hypothetical protein